MLCYALEHPAVGTVTAIGRRQLGISHPKLKEVLPNSRNVSHFAIVREQHRFRHLQEVLKNPQRRCGSRIAVVLALWADDKEGAWWPEASS